MPQWNKSVQIIQWEFWSALEQVSFIGIVVFILCLIGMSRKVGGFYKNVIVYYYRKDSRISSVGLWHSCDRLPQPFRLSCHLYPLQTEQLLNIEQKRWLLEVPLQCLTPRWDFVRINVSISLGIHRNMGLNASGVKQITAGGTCHAREPKLNIPQLFQLK